MNFLSPIFLWAAITIAVPILIALWNRRRFQKEAFGGFYLLQQILETTHRRFRILELLKLLNRIALFLFLVALFANPFRVERRLENAGDGFAIIVDVGRVMQSPGADARPFALQANDRLINLLKQIPQQAQGALFFVSDRCDSANLLGSHRLTARASEWLDVWSKEQLPLTGQATTSQGLSQCLQRVRGLFGEKKIYTAFISPMPSSIDSNVLESSRLHLERLSSSKLAADIAVDIQQDISGEKLKVLISPPSPRRAKLIQAGRVEDLGDIDTSIDLLGGESSFLSVGPREASDPWIGQKIIPLHQASSLNVTLWAERESPGYLSLLAALRNYNGLKVSRQIGGEPTGESVIVYRSFKFDPTSLRRAWFFVDFEHAVPFVVRDQKQWVAGLDLLDARKAFQMETQDGRIFVKKYILLDLDRYETLETFEDGAPSLLRDRESVSRHWISPFDLEDLTTDLSLEPTFIPYFYRRLERWLAVDQAAQSGEWEVLWTMPGVLKPTHDVLARQAWPGIYIDSKAGGQFKIVEPAKLPAGFLETSNHEDEISWKDEKVFFKDKILMALAVCLAVELLLCLMSVRWVWIGILLLCSLGLGDASLFAGNNIIRPISIGILSGIDADRKLALTQSFLDFEHMSNLVFEKPEETTPSKFWNYSAIVITSTKPFGPFKKEEREQIRDYCERGGVLIFDDPLASADSEFYRSVKRELGEIFSGREMVSIPKEDVVFRTFYLLSEVSGRKLSSPYLEGISLDKRWVAIFSFNDILGAILKSARGDYALSVSPYGISQRNLAKRLWLNLMMYSVTLDYKDDAIHLPHILKRRVR